MPCRYSSMSPGGGRRWVVETDIASCFEAIPHSGLMSAIEERIVDRQVLKLLRSMLRAGVMDDGAVRRPVTGTPQGVGWEFVQELQLGENHLRDFLDWCEEIVLRDGGTIADLLAKPALRQPFGAA